MLLILKIKQQEMGTYGRVETLRLLVEAQVFVLVALLKVSMIHFKTKIIAAFYSG